MIDFLISVGADINAMNSWNLTPLTVAALKNNFGCIKTFLKYPDVNVNCKDDEGRTIVSSAIDNINEKSLEYLKFLINVKGADVKISDLDEKTPLHYCC